MSLARVTCLAACLVGLLAPAGAGQGLEELAITAHDDGDEFWFEVEGRSGRNPELLLVVGQTYVLRLENDGSTSHAVEFGLPVGVRSDLAEADGSVDLSFTVPEDARGTAAYWCPIHRGQGMEGVVRFDAPEEAGRVPFLPAGVLLVLLGLVAMARRQ